MKIVQRKSQPLILSPLVGWLFVVAVLVAPVSGQVDPAEKAAIEAVKRYRTNLQTNKDGTVRLVRFSQPHVTDEILVHLRQFKNIDYLAVVCPQVTDAGIANVAGLTNLDTLALSETRLTNQGLAHLQSLAKLQRLYLEKTSITDEGLARLKGLLSLRILSLRKTKITDAGLAHLAELKSLQTLFLCDTDVTDAGLAHLAPLENLETLYLVRTKVMGPGLATLAKMKTLKHMSLSGTGVTGEALEHLKNAAGLKEVLLYNTSVTRADVLKLKASAAKIEYYVDQPQYAGSPLHQKSRPSIPKPQPADVKGAPLPPANKRFASAQVNETPDFQRHVIPLLGRLGCNGRSCHGSFQGQGGFRLSMFGYDFDMDLKNLTAGDDPRVDVDSPLESLILNKPTSDDNHEGGLRFAKGGWEYQLLLRWITDGAKGRPGNGAHLVRLQITPPEIVFQKEAEEAQLRAQAIWSDGSAEDVTCLTRFETKDDAAAEVSPEGLVRSTGKGDTHIIAYYDNGVTATPVITPFSNSSNQRISETSSLGGIDQLVLIKLNKLGIVPSAIATDEEFLRRVHLDLIGTLPTPEEIQQFLADDAADKRSRKIDELLERPAYITWWTTRLCDLTGSNAGYLGGTEMAQPVAALWRKWIERRVRDNVGWDKIAAGILLATSRKPGQTYEEYIAEQSRYTARRNPTDFSALDNRMPIYWFRDNLKLAQDKALAFGYTFLGVRLQCAQCHKHPFDQWSKEEFDQFKQFFTRIATGLQPDAKTPHDRLREKLGVPVKLNTAALRRQSYMRIAAEGRPIPWREVFIKPAGEKPQIAKLLGGAELDLRDYEDPRRPLVEWLLKKNNRYFAKAFVNRIWAHYFHVGIVDPPDDLNLANPPSNAPLLDWLAKQFIAHDYDLKWLHRTITRSQTYQRSWRPNATNRRDRRNFSRAVVRRLPAEVAIDAMIQATAGEAQLAKAIGDVKNRKIGQHPRSYQARSIDFSLLIFGKPLRTTNCDCERKHNPTLLQALYVRNDRELLELLQRPGGWLSQMSRRLGQTLTSEVTGKKDLTPKPRPGKEMNATIKAEKMDMLIRQAYLRTLSREPRDEELAQCRRHITQASNTVEGLRDVMWALLNTREFITNH